tara:strand:+ start:23919 stop:25529 length:1611 start_codon:yes stop_codon:yes gene_type:complete
MGTEFAQNYERALSGYTSEAGQINDNLAAWRSDIDMTRQANKTGFASAKSQAENKVDMDAIKGVADEFGLQGGKKIFEKYVTNGLFDSKFGGLVSKSANDVSKELGDKFRSAVKSKLGIGESSDEVGGKALGGSFEDFVKNKLGGTANEASARLDNLRAVGEGKMDDGMEMTRRIQAEPKLKSRFGMEDDATEMRRPRVSGDDMGDNPDPFGRDQARGVEVDEDEVSPGIRSTGEPVNTPMEDLPVTRNPPLSDRVATPEGGNNVPSYDELKTRFDSVTKPQGSVRGSSIEMQNRGETKGGMDEDDPFEGMDFGEFKGQGGPPAESLRDFNFRTDPSMQPDALGMGNGASRQGVRNAAADAEQASQDALSSARSGIAGASKAGEDMAENARGALSRLSSMGQEGLNVGQKALADGSEGGGSLLSSGLKKLGVGAGEEAGEETGGGIAEGIGAILDATPLAPLGALFGLIGVGLDAGAAYQAGQGIAGWVSQDILGHHPAVNFNKAKIPTTASLPRSFSITPTMDSVMDTGSGGGSW